ncbi:Uncharacterised protein [[Clostridium] sordellii]|uniref:hypothetical protein n=1 Tax=Paraclostridium sordellii TaxID=1505 RepID=UPI0005DEAD2D|nr:hypothetical protein [Paeniclostridium sordellii]CEP79243.1 Uncharacterised protein [[Clostridium] sordellii] [Paeniclostridium sordellii]
MNRQKEIDEVYNFMKNKGISFKELMMKDISNDLERFKSLIEWSSKDYEEYKILLEKAKKSSGKKDSEEKTKEVGDILEELVTFIIERTYFFEVIRNIRTRTNEIDLYITRSKEGSQALNKYNLSEDFIIIPEKEFISECKNYSKNIGTTWFGKFYAVMKTCDCNFGILFSLKRATGNFDNWSDSYGLIRTIRLIEKYENKKELYLIDFGLDDFDSISEENNFFDIIENKIKALKIGTDYDKFVKNLQKQLDEEKKSISEKFKKLKNSN